MSRTRDAFIFLFVDHVEIERNVDTPVGISVVRSKKVNNFAKTTFKAVSQLQMSDANNCVHFECEFKIRTRLVVKKGHSKCAKKNVVIRFYTVSMKEKKTIFSWKIDAANTPKGDGFDMLELVGNSDEFGEIKMYYRVNIEDCDKFNNEQAQNPKFMYSRTFGDVLINFDEDVVTDVKELVSETNEPTHIHFESNNRKTKLSRFVKPLEKKKIIEKSENENDDAVNDEANKGKMKWFLKNNENVNEKPWVQENTQNGEFQYLVSSHEENLLKLALNQCSVCFCIEIVNNLICPIKIFRDFSNNLIEPILSFSILSFPGLTAKDIDFLFEPLYKALDHTLSLSHTFEELFSILASILNFGLKLSDNVPFFSSLHLPVLEKLSEYINQTIMQLTQIFISVISPSISNDGFEFADVETMNLIQQETRQFLQLCHSFDLPELIVQTIVIETCKYIDTLVFNVIINTSSIISPKKINDLLQKTRKIEKLFECLSCNFQIAFNNLLSFISNTNLLWSNQVNLQIEKSDLMRSIIERCQPEIKLPNNMQLDDIGKHMDKTESLKLPFPEFGFEFSYELLYTYNSNRCNENTK